MVSAKTGRSTRAPHLIIWDMYQYIMKHRRELWLGTPDAASVIESRIACATCRMKFTAAGPGRSVVRRT